MSQQAPNKYIRQTREEVRNNLKAGKPIRLDPITVAVKAALNINYINLVT